MAEVAADPENPQHLVVRYENPGGGGLRRGLIVSDDGGKSWKLMCSDAIHAQVWSGASTQVDAGAEYFKFEVRRMTSVLLRKGGATLVGAPAGLLTGDAHGCGFRAEPLFLQQGTQLLAHPKDSEVAFALLAWGGSAQGLWRRGPDGVWARFGASEPPPQEGDTVAFKSAIVARRDPDLRVYQTVSRFNIEAGTVRESVRVSDDGAMSWREHPLPAAGEGLELLAADPTQLERVVGVVRRVDGRHREWSRELDTLMLSEDGGQNFRAYFDVAELGAVAFGPDGTLYIADSGARVGEETRAGLFRAAPGLAAGPVQLSPDPYQCLSYASVNQTLYACQGIRVGTLDAATGAFGELVRLDTVGGLVTCPGLDTKSTCQDQLCTSGYCLYTHYPRAPLCTPYDSKYCGPSSALDEPDAALPDAAAAGDAGAPEDMDAGDDDGLDGSASGVQQQDAQSPDPDETDRDPAPASDSSGCDCRVGSGSGGAARGAGWVGLLALLVARRRRVQRDGGGARANT
ncbi:MAG TPA: MYXO-CTERM sorting domain-containing protein [Polyangiales bacterium]